MRVVIIIGIVLVVLWAVNQNGDDDTSSVTNTPDSVPTRVLATRVSIPPPPNCDRSYPTICIPPGIGDLDCADVSARRFRVLQPDPHGFDADFDGIGCESW